MTIIECVPNFSEGRRSDVATAIVDAVRRSGSVRVLDFSSDADHNRSVLTFAGVAPAVRAAVEALVAACIERIDLRTHQGRHPRMGAVDVIPFIPVRGVTMAECVALARETGAEIARRHDLPVYLYEEAATSPARRNLAEIRKGEFEGFPEKMKDPRFKPDFGPDRVHPTAGCVAVGAREFLIAFNINLMTDDLEIARAIARTIRWSSGGLPAVKAMGVLLEERRQAQVSINMTNFRETALHTVLEKVRVEAARHGTAIAGSEIVGLVPEEALFDVAASALKLEGFDPSKVLERRLSEETEASGPGTPPSGRGAR